MSPRYDAEYQFLSWPNRRNGIHRDLARVQLATTIANRNRLDSIREVTRDLNILGGLRATVGNANIVFSVLPNRDGSLGIVDMQHQIRECLDGGDQRFGYIDVSFSRALDVNAVVARTVQLAPYFHFTSRTGP